MSERYQMQQIRVPVTASRSDVLKKIYQRLGRGDVTLTDLEIVRASIDARDKRAIRSVYTVEFGVADRRHPERPVRLPLGGRTGLREAPVRTYRQVEAGTMPLPARPVIVGFGPCGIFCALLLARRGYAPLVIERGGCMEDRVAAVERFWQTGTLDPACNVQFGEGGAGTFSDGKLTTGIRDPRIHWVLDAFAAAGADPDIRYQHRPHIGTDVLRTVVQNLRAEICRCGGEVRFDTRFVGLRTADGQVTGVTVARADGAQEEIPTSAVVLAIGHSARDTFRGLLDQGVGMRQKPFSIGVRVEHPQAQIDRAQYGETAGLPPADYKLSYRCADGRGVYTFCMCPGGEIIVASSGPGQVVTNGMSDRARDSGRANSGLLVDVRCEDFGSAHPLAGVVFQETYERLAFVNGGGDYTPPETTWAAFRDGAETAQPVLRSLPAFAAAAIREAMPALGRKLAGFDDDSTRMVAVETRSSSPVRFDRDEALEGTFRGLYPAGEGAGYAGGIMSAACDGIRVAEQIIGKYCTETSV